MSHSSTMTVQLTLVLAPLLFNIVQLHDYTIKLNPYLFEGDSLLRRILRNGGFVEPKPPARAVRNNGAASSV